jgi:hypothetical protein
MKHELDEKLCEKYPEIFRDRHGDKMATAMCWGFECGDGWYDIIDALCGCVQGYTSTNEKPQVVAVQVKEKYGTLRFYTYGGNDFTEGMIWMAEAMSARTCEVCGNPGKLWGGGWVRTLCDEHALECGHKPILGAEEHGP